MTYSETYRTYRTYQKWYFIPKNARRATVFWTPTLASITHLAAECCWWTSLFKLSVMTWFVWHGLYDVVCMTWFVWHGMYDMVCMTWFVWHGLYDVVCHLFSGLLDPTSATRARRDRGKRAHHQPVQRGHGEAKGESRTTENQVSELCKQSGSSQRSVNYVNNLDHLKDQWIM